MGYTPQLKLKAASHTSKILKLVSDAAFFWFKKQWKLTNNPMVEGWHNWSPDGNQLAFDSSDPEQSQFHIFLMDWKTKKTVQLTDTTFHYQFAPVFVKKR